MANDLSSIVPKILARGLLSLREQAVMPRLVNLDYAMAAAEKGDTINIPVPGSLSADNVVPGSTPTASTDVTGEKVSIALDQWKKVSFHLSDKELMEIDGNNTFVPMQMSEAVAALAAEANKSIQELYTGVYGFVGATDAKAFASNTTAATNARKLLNEQKAPKANRRAVLDFDTEADALSLSAFSDTSTTGDQNVKLEGEIGRKFGFDWYSDDNVQVHTTGAAGTSLVKGGSQTGTSLIVDGFTTKPSVGDVFTIASGTQTYTVLAATDLSGTESTLTISPAITVAPSNDDSVTFKDDHVVNLAFHRDAFAFVTRPLVDATQSYSLGNEIMTMQDPQTGLIMRLEISRQNKRTVWELDMLYGAALIRPELAVRVASQV